MPSLVLELQSSAQSSTTSVVDLLRRVKVVAAKLGLSEMNEWVERELNGYHEKKDLPAYRYFRGGDLFVFNPMRGWQFTDHIKIRLPCIQSVQEIESLRTEKVAKMTLNGPNRIQLQDRFGAASLDDWPQEIRISNTEFVSILNVIRNKVLDWSLELEKRGILGENMSFDQKERETAHQHINIQNFNGVLGPVSNSNVTVYDYSTVHQTLKDLNVPQAERNELENIMDGLKKGDPAEKPSLLERSKQWLVKNEAALGTSIRLIRTAVGLPSDT